MSRLIKNVEELKDQFKEIDPKLTNFEAFTLALDLQRNELFQEAFLVRFTESTNLAPYIPSAMEKVVQELEEMNEYINEIRVTLDEK